MAELPSPEESARAIVGIFNSQGLGAGNEMPLWALEQGFTSLCLLALHFTKSDFHDGLRSALEKGWLMKNGENIQLTELGYSTI